MPNGYAVAALLADWAGCSCGQLISWLNDYGISLATVSGALPPR
jgi:hypothetical protein